MWPDSFGISAQDLMENIHKLYGASIIDEKKLYVVPPNNEEPEEEPIDINKYFKVVYQTDPIGERGIVLKLTSFDMEAYERDKNRKTIPTEEVSYFVEDPALLHAYYGEDEIYNSFVSHLKDVIEEHYFFEIEKLKSYIETHREVATVTEKKVIKGNITNSDNIVCDVIEGNVVNCDNVKVREIRGNTVNCDIRKEGY